jgi:hypothetical protein
MREGNTAHAQDCKYHSDRLNAGPAPAIFIPDDDDDEPEDDEVEVAGDNEVERDIEAANGSEVEDESEEIEEDIDDVEETVAAVAARWNRLIHRH